MTDLNAIRADRQKILEGVRGMLSLHTESLEKMEDLNTRALATGQHIMAATLLNILEYQEAQLQGLETLSERLEDIQHILRMLDINTG